MDTRRQGARARRIAARRRVGGCGLGSDGGWTGPAPAPCRLQLQIDFGQQTGVDQGAVERAAGQRDLVALAQGVQRVRHARPHLLGQLQGVDPAGLGQQRIAAAAVFMVDEVAVELALWAMTGASPMKSARSMTISANFGASLTLSSVMPWTRVASGGISRSGLTKRWKVRPVGNRSMISIQPTSISSSPVRGSKPVVSWYRGRFRGS